MDAAHVASPSLTFLSAAIHGIVVLLGVLQNEITGVFKSVRAIKSCTSSIWHCVLEVADVTLKNSGCTVYAGVREHITRGEQEAHVPERVQFSHVGVDGAIVGVCTKTRTLSLTCHISSHVKDVFTCCFTLPSHAAHAFWSS